MMRKLILIIVVIIIAGCANQVEFTGKTFWRTQPSAINNIKPQFVQLSDDLLTLTENYWNEHYQQTFKVYIHQAICRVFKNSDSGPKIKLVNSKLDITPLDSEIWNYNSHYTIIVLFDDRLIVGRGYGHSHAEYNEAIAVSIEKAIAEVYWQLFTLLN